MRGLLCVTFLAAGLGSCGNEKRFCYDADCSSDIYVHSSIIRGTLENRYVEVMRESGPTYYVCEDWVPERVEEVVQLSECSPMVWRIPGEPYDSFSDLEYVRIIEADGEVIRRRNRVLLDIERLRPNGPDCEPSCVVVEMR